MAALSTRRKPELLCPAGSLRALQVAIDAGADTVYMGLRDATNARNFAGLNFDLAATREGIAYAHARRRKVLMALNTFADARDEGPWRRAVDTAASLGIDALILADLAVMAYAARDASRAAAAPVGAGLGHQLRGDRVLPRALRHRAGGAAARADGVAGRVPDPQHQRRDRGVRLRQPVRDGRGPLPPVLVRHGAVAEQLRRVLAGVVRALERAADGSVDARLNGIQINRFGADEPRAYPTLCKGRFEVEGDVGYAIEEPTSLNTLSILPELMAAGIAAIKIEGRQRSPAYVAEVTRVWRAAIDACYARPARYSPQPAWTSALGRLAEGQQQTLGAYSRPWK